MELLGLNAGKFESALPHPVLPSCMPAFSGASPTTARTECHSGASQGKKKIRLKIMINKKRKSHITQRIVNELNE